eukprot:NODE_2829_length_399_cov_123.974286_g2747_i0.p4 GENE.NODE_2829_length_399_cov_123.974286_g2747_i0~~NODE_2829_length_399_cov_123.974286_g2747_i0.p4  ORF type:complete len:58 (+),score=20.27 NODE_2829_length_399_cov_123.974286_g2747_i0:25-174(+)
MGVSFWVVLVSPLGIGIVPPKPYSWLCASWQPPHGPLGGSALSLTAHSL